MYGVPLGIRRVAWRPRLSVPHHERLRDRGNHLSARRERVKGGTKIGVNDGDYLGRQHEVGRTVDRTSTRASTRRHSPTTSDAPSTPAEHTQQLHLPPAHATPLISSMPLPPATQRRCPSASVHRAWHKRKRKKQTGSAVPTARNRTPCVWGTSRRVVCLGGADDARKKNDSGVASEAMPRAQDSPKMRRKTRR